MAEDIFKDLGELNKEELYDLAVALYERDILIAKQNRVNLFRYDVADDTLFFVFVDRHDGEVRRRKTEHYLTSENYAFSTPTRSVCVNLFRDYIEGRKTESTGSFEMPYKEGGQYLRCDYKCVYDRNGKLHSILGQFEDVTFTREKMLKTIEKQNEYMRIINSLKTSFESIIYFDLEKLNYSLISATDALKSVTRKNGTMNEMAQIFCTAYVMPEYKKLFTDFINFDDLAERLKGKQYIMAEYATFHLGWVVARIIPANVNADGNVTHALLTTECADELHRETIFLRQAAETDGLTGLLNRYAGKREIEKCVSEKKVGVFALFDCDRFKQINDTLSHLVGDSVLVEIAQTMKETFKNQIVMRLGGDEFIVFITGSEVERRLKSKDGLVGMFDQMKLNLEGVTIPELEGTHITMSGGVVAYNNLEGVTFEDMYKLADEALYVSKKKRNGNITITCR